MPITHSCYVYNFPNELATVLETLIYYLQRCYLLVKGGEVQVLWSYSHFTGSGNGSCTRQSLVPIPVTEPGTGIYHPLCIIYFVISKMNKNYGQLRNN